MLEFPDSFAVNWWVEYLPTSDNSEIKKYLPKIDKEWKDRIMSVVSLVHMNYNNGYIAQDVHSVASFVFYKINKAHNEIDGNKRSAIIITYLFYLINDYALVTGEEIRLIAKRVAKSKGKKNQDLWLKRIKEVFIRTTVSIK
jgi:prophage maintenance system killer protein